MHASVFRFVHETVYTNDLTDRPTLELGSFDVNGSVRPMFTGPYVGIDMRAGPGVDVVTTSWSLPFADDQFDVVLTTEMLEHDAHPACTFAEAARVLGNDGTFVLTTRAPGFPLHEYPHDLWRYEPDDIARWFDWCGLETVEVSPDPTDPGVFAIARKNAKAMPAGPTPELRPV